MIRVTQVPDAPEVAVTRALSRVGRVAAPPDRVFAHLDDQTRLAAHMVRPSAMMGGGRMNYEFDAARGQAVGSRIRMTGSAFGLRLAVDEVVVSREPPRQKSWRTEGKPRLVVVTGYDMGFDISADESAASQVRVWIRYQPQRIRGFPGFVALCLSHWFARWCVNRMLADAISTFEAPSSP